MLKYLFMKYHFVFYLIEVGSCFCFARTNKILSLRSQENHILLRNDSTHNKITIGNIKMTVDLTKQFLVRVCIVRT